MSTMKIYLWKSLTKNQLFVKVFCLMILCTSIIISLHLIRIIYYSNNVDIKNTIDSRLVSTASWKTTKSSKEFNNINNTNLRNMLEHDIIQDIQHQIPNLPIMFWNQIKNKKMELNSTCARFPDFFEIHYSNDYWQTLETANGTFQLFGTYLDLRKNNIKRPAIRILGMIDRIEPPIAAYCQIWFSNSTKPIISPITDYKYIWDPKWGNYQQGIYQPYLMSCNIPKKYWKGRQPSAVSIVEKACDRGVTLLTVLYNKPKEKKKNFAVCVKGFSYPHEDLSVKLIQWIELLNLLGVDRIFFNVLSLHPSVKRVLEYYEKEGKVNVSRLKLAGSQPGEPLLQDYYLKHNLISKRQNEIVPYNDCFYKHMYEYKFIVLLDVHEIIIPLKNASWKELIDDISKKSKELRKAKPVDGTFYSVQNVYFFDDPLRVQNGRIKGIPRYMHMLQHVYRANNLTTPGLFMKSFFNTKKALLVHDQLPLACLGTCSVHPIDNKEAQLQNYRKDCVSEACDDFKNNSVMDITIWKFIKPLTERVTSVLKTLGYFKNETLLKR